VTSLPDLKFPVIIFSPYALHQEVWKLVLASQPGLIVAGATVDPSQITAFIPTDQAGTILIDLPNPQPEIARQLKMLSPHSGLLFLVQSYELPIILALLQAGATGFISRHASVGDLARAIIAAGRGEIVLPPEIAFQSLVALAQGQPADKDLSEPLTDRESDVLKLLTQGLTNKDIAQTLFLSVRTVEAHLRSIFAKLSVGSRTEAALWAVQNGYRAQSFK
jgi:DNA-binding NarL/FixJ family response regulator